MKDYFDSQSDHTIRLDAKAMILYYVDKIMKVLRVFNLMILLGSFRFIKPSSEGLAHCSSPSGWNSRNILSVFRK